MRYALLTAALSPALVPQGLWTRWRTPRLPEPVGPRTGGAGSGPPLRLLIAGDSAAAGVGAPHQKQALSGQLVQRLATERSVSWRLEAKTGATTAATIDRLEALAATRFDVAVLSLGVNDVTGGVTVSRWQRQQLALWALLRDKFGVRLLIACGLPPMHGFPALPQPLRWHLGSRATQFDRILQRLAATASDTRYFDLRFTRDVNLMAADGFHPGPEVYRRWADGTAALIRDGSDALN